MSQPSSRIASSIVWAFAICIVMGGCDAPEYSFEPNEIFAKRLELTEAVSMNQPLEDVNLALEDLFGTPDDPKWPDVLENVDGNSLVSVERLQQAAGAISSDEQGRHLGLYREHCVACHGVTGDGLGPTAALLNPYPRDFRMGKVKFKSTPIGVKPTRQDLVDTLRRGIVGTSMPSFRLLPEEEIEALVDYVIYLAIRGELERKLLAFASLDLDLEEGERLYDPNLEADDPDLFEEQVELITDFAGQIVRDWRRAEDRVEPVPLPPEGFVLVSHGWEKLPLADQERLVESVQHGKELFRGNVASCAFCHGPEALGDGQQNNYDDWTRDWTSQAGLNPADEESLQPMLDLGALDPRPILPRNLRRGIFRGGGDPRTLYRRIVHGIEGTPMPAAPMKPGNPQGLTEQDVWDLVNYLLSLEQAVPESAIAAQESVGEDPARG